MGEGATAKVYLAEHQTLHQYRAIKCIPKKVQFYEQVRKEADLLIQLKSNAIPVIYDIEEDENQLCIIEEYMEGESLLSYRQQIPFISESGILSLSLQICSLIKYLHSMQIPILYLDLKPSNFMIRNGKLKLIDFGSARSKALILQSAGYGTKGFAAPEQYQTGAVDEAADLYGIGMLMYYLMTGRIRAAGGDLPNVMAIQGYSRALRRLVARAIRHNPCERYASVEVLEHQLRLLASKEKKKHDLANTSKTIALVGSQRRTGVTHMAFYLLSQLRVLGKRAIYIECGNTNVVSALACECECIDKSYVCYRGFRLSRLDWLRNESLQEYDYVIYDYGVLTKDCIEEFMQADYRIAVLGGAVWERQASFRTVSILSSQSDIRYVFNHMTAREYHQVVKSVRGISTYRMPLEGDALSLHVPMVKEFVRTILE